MEPGSARCHNQSAIRGPRKCLDRGFDLGCVEGIDRAKLHPEGLSYRLDDSELANPGASRGIANDRHPGHVVRDLFEQLEPFCAQAVFECGETGHIAARMRQALDQPAAPTSAMNSRRLILLPHQRGQAGRRRQWMGTPPARPSSVVLTIRPPRPDTSPGARAGTMLSPPHQSRSAGYTLRYRRPGWWQV